MYSFKVWNESEEEMEIISDEIEKCVMEEEVLPETIQGEAFVQFLDLCFQEATYFSLKKAWWTECNDTSLQEELKSFLEKEITTLKWFGYDYSVAPEEDKREMNIYIYRATNEAKAILIRFFEDIFLREKKNMELVDSSQTLEDLCFFSANSIIVGTVSHEFLLEVFPPNLEFEQAIKQFGSWDFREEIYSDIHI